MLPQFFLYTFVNAIKEHNGMQGNKGGHRVDKAG
jgi:hypothetical protein